MHFIRRLLCVHDFIRVFEPHRVSLRCLNCGHTTRGWTLKEKPSEASESVLLALVRRRTATTSGG